MLHTISPSRPPAAFAIVGDVHGHLQLALCTLARWQRERREKFSAIFLCGDIGTFTDHSQLDSATRKHARNNPCELEFLTQWSLMPQPPWLDAIFLPEPDGLGFDCPILMMHGNHEGFDHLSQFQTARHRSTETTPIDQLPTVDSNGHILFLRSGGRCITPDGYTIAGVGGMEAGQRRSKYHPMAYIQEEWVDDVLCGPPVDILLTHQGPARVQGDHGSPTLDLLVDASIARFWFHGHSTPVKDITTLGQTTVVPLGDLPFCNGLAGDDAFAILKYEQDEPTLNTDPPNFLREYRQSQWYQTPGGRLVHPDLVKFLPASQQKELRRFTSNG